MTAQPSPWHTGLAAVLADRGDYLGDLAAKNDRLMAARRTLDRDAIKRGAIANWQIDRPGVTLTASDLAALEAHIATLCPEPVTDAQLCDDWLATADAREPGWNDRTEG